MKATLCRYITLAMLAGWVSLHADTKLDSSKSKSSDVKKAELKKPTAFTRGAVSLGVQVSKPQPAIYAQLPALPRGCGFVIQSVAPGGTAEAAGIRPMDVIWKLGDQILVNEGQMMTLLSHYIVGQEVKVNFFRSGKNEQATLHFSNTLNDSGAHGVVLMPPLPAPLKVISYEERSASISDKTGTATLTVREGKPWLQIENTHGEETFNGFIVKEEEISRVPLVWRNRLAVLKRSLDESTRLRKLPRVRRVPRNPKRESRIVGE